MNKLDNNMPEGLIIIAHCVHAEISEKEILDALPDNLKTIPRNFIKISPIKIDIKEASNLNWDDISRKQVKEFDEKVKIKLDLNPNYTVVYAGFAPIPLIVHLGSLFSNWSKIICLFKHHEDHKWYYSFDTIKQLNYSDIKTEELNINADTLNLSVSISNKVSKESLEGLSIDSVGAEISFGLTNPDYDILSSQRDLADFANKTHEILKSISENYPNVNRINLFASLPVACAFIFGSKIQPNVHPLIQTFQYNRTEIPNYEAAILVNTDYENIDYKKVLLVVATEIEAKELLKQSKSYGKKPQPNDSYEKLIIWNLGRINNSELLMVKTGNMGSGGPAGATLTIGDAIKKISPDFVIMPGIAFGLKQNSQEIGTVLTSKQIEPYELMKVKEDNIEIKRSDTIPASIHLLSRFENAALQYDGDIRFGQVLSGEKLVDNKLLVEKFILKYPEAIGGEMEGAGLVSACHREEVDWLLIKGVCDWGYDKNAAGIDKEKDQELAIRNVCDFLFYTIMNFKL
ncbi:SAVED domain-containing protein [Lacinutrix sp. MEBiC02404]